jgi:hypothetical protein
MTFKGIIRSKLNMIIPNLIVILKIKSNKKKKEKKKKKTILLIFLARAEY